jgi:hypothetical protein
VAVALLASAMYVQGALPGTITVAPAVGVDAKATPGSAGSALASYQPSTVMTDDATDVFDWAIPKRLAPEVVTTS